MILSATFSYLITQEMNLERPFDYFDPAPLLFIKSTRLPLTEKNMRSNPTLFNHPDKVQFHYGCNPFHAFDHSSIPSPPRLVHPKTLLPKFLSRFLVSCFEQLSQWIESVGSVLVDKDKFKLRVHVHVGDLFELCDTLHSRGVYPAILSLYYSFFFFMCRYHCSVVAK